MEDEKINGWDFCPKESWADHYEFHQMKRQNRSSMKLAEEISRTSGFMKFGGFLMEDVKRTGFSWQFGKALKMFPEMIISEI